ncbi:MAG: hypothetical protein M9962_03450 [Oligoflexia bacterium]|nr:hypothetical protein [Oligoflexia bacterium]
MRSVDMVLSLLDIQGRSPYSNSVEQFQQFEQLVNLSLVDNSTEKTNHHDEESPKKHFQFASRLQRTNYEDQMKAEALISAIQKLREKNDHAAKSRNSS